MLANSSTQQNITAIEKYRFIHHFVPHEHHKTRAKLLSNRAIFSYVFMLVVLLGVVTFVSRRFPGVLGYASDINIVDLFKYTNAEREAAGLSDLKLNEELTKAAEQKADDMFKNNYWAHVSPAGTEPWDFILAQNYDYVYAGENLAKNFNSSKEVADAWYRSPSHRENLLSTNYDEVGFSVKNGILNGYETTLVVQMFGRPRDSSLVATETEQQKILASYKTESAPAFLGAGGRQFASVLPAVDVSVASRSISMVIGGFVAFLLILDIWYTKKKSIPKFTGHTLAHLTLLILALIGIWFVLSPGKLI